MHAPGPDRRPYHNLRVDLNQSRNLGVWTIAALFILIYTLVTVVFIISAGVEEENEIEDRLSGIEVSETRGGGSGGSGSGDNSKSSTTGSQGSQESSKVGSQESSSVPKQRSTSSQDSQSENSGEESSGKNSDHTPKSEFVEEFAPTPESEFVWT
jgi:hypothetical protein